MCLAMTSQQTIAAVDTSVNESQKSASCGSHNTYVKIDEVRIIYRTALRTADTMRVVTNVAGCVFFRYMLVVKAEGVV